MLVNEASGFTHFDLISNVEAAEMHDRTQPTDRNERTATENTCSVAWRNIGTEFLRGKRTWDAQVIVVQKT